MFSCAVEIAPNFTLPYFRGRAFRKNCAHLNTPASRHVAWKSFVKPQSYRLVNRVHYLLKVDVAYSQSASEIALYTRVQKVLQLAILD